jgi:tripartite-type tricarboxylate transporter receptor subunit TctC
MTNTRLLTWSLTLLLLAACTPAAPSGSPISASPAGSPISASPSIAVVPSPSPVAAANPATFDEQAVANFYRGKTVRMVVGYSAGGGNDVVSRILARHLPSYIPGNPTIVVENKPGAATMLAVNTVYNVEPKDGSVLANFNQQLVLAQAIGTDGVQFDAAKFVWLGASSKDPLLCVVRSDRGINDVQEVIGGGKEIVYATTGPGSPPHDGPAVMDATLGTHFKLVSGYAGSAQQDLAVQNGEADGKCGVLDTSTLDGLKSGFLKPLIVMSDRTPDSPYLRGVPAAETLAKNADDLALLRAVEAPMKIVRAFVAPPGVPADRIAALRQAFVRTYADPDFIAEAPKAQLSVDPSTGEETEQVVRSVLALPAPVLDRLKKILTPS